MGRYTGQGGVPLSLPAPGLAGYLVHSPEKATLALGWALGRQQGDLGKSNSLEMGREGS